MNERTADTARERMLWIVRHDRLTEKLRHFDDPALMASYADLYVASITGWPVYFTISVGNFVRAVGDKVQRHHAEKLHAARRAADRIMLERMNAQRNMYNVTR